MQVIEGEKDPAFVEKIIRSLMDNSLDEILESEEIQERLRPILKQHEDTVALIKERASYSKGVVSFDLTDKDIEGYNKFIPYYFYPQTTYNVALTQGPYRTKISVGSNPWSPRPRLHNIAEICEKYGGWWSCRCRSRFVEAGCHRRGATVYAGNHRDTSV